MGHGCMQSAALFAGRRYSMHEERKGQLTDQIECEQGLIVFLVFQVSVMCNLFNESRSDRQSKEVLGEITDYNKRYSGAPRRVSALSQLHTHTSFFSLNSEMIRNCPSLSAVVFHSHLLLPLSLCPAV